MAARNDLVVWSHNEARRLAKLTAQGVSAHNIADALNREFHGGKLVRTMASVQLKRGKLGLHVGPRPKKIQPVPEREQSIEQTANGDGIEARANGSRIKTVDDLVRHIKADMTRFEIAASEATKYEVATKDPATGKVTTTELHRVFVRLKPKAGPSVIEVVESVIAAAFAKRKAITPPARVVTASSDVMQCVVIADVHIGKYAWRHETGWDDYDIGIAARMLRAAADELLQDGNAAGVGSRTIALLGDFFHYDTPHGATTKGTPLDRDGRVEKMMEEGARVLFDIIEASAKTLPTNVVLVPGNHDAVLTIALRQILSAHFRNDPRVRVDARGTSRKYLRHGKCLIGLAHGDKAQKRLGELMALEAREDWGQTTYREMHTGHFHSMAEVHTIGGVVIRTHPALCPPDGWHALEGYVGATRGMQSFYYHADGGLVGMRMSNPDMRREQ